MAVDTLDVARPAGARRPAPLRVALKCPAEDWWFAPWPGGSGARGGPGVTWPATLVGLATYAAVPAGVALPALLDVDVPGRWIAQAVGLL
ncbi:hypothetical protein OHB39_20745 [Streptomyces sp. NBC_00047]|uniref:hypothetical protein n=1 Tax=Streptomyces sp. NBC_00047 TaxID=2975627 RepID=UPI00225C308B|nr:hypothetical protein [Streptomyces sp. NBC_00047]MCX5609993.1 hypothetical protein [Streptomyces sp. NBC_00047]